MFLLPAMCICKYVTSFTFKKYLYSTSFSAALTPTIGIVPTKRNTVRITDKVRPKNSLFHKSFSSFLSLEYIGNRANYL